MKTTKANAEKALRILEAACDTTLAPTLAPTEKEWKFVHEFMVSVYDVLCAVEIMHKAKRRRTRGEK